MFVAESSVPQFLHADLGPLWLRGLSIAREVKDEGIRITTIYPGEVETPSLDNRPVPVSAEHRARILQPEDLAAAVVMIAELPPRANVSEIVVKPTTQDFA